MEGFSHALWANMEESQRRYALKLLSAHKESYEKGAYLLLEEQSDPRMGVVLSGRIEVSKQNVQGETNIIGQFSKGALFAETYVCLGQDKMPVSVRALEKCEVLWLEHTALWQEPSAQTEIQTQLLLNLIHILAQKNAALNRKMQYLTHKTIRARLEAFFSDLAAQTGSMKFTVPMDRNQMAEYLGMDRSAMCRALSHMKKQGLLDYHKNRFHWKIKNAL